MGFIKSSNFISIDGVVESPDTWHFPYVDDQMGAVVGELMNETVAMLLGRRTYDGFASYWRRPPTRPGCRQAPGSAQPAAPP